METPLPRLNWLGPLCRLDLRPPRPERADARVLGNELLHTIDLLWQGWCHRGAQRPIQQLLRAYPGPLWHTYQQMELRDTLEELLRLHPELLTAEEQKLLQGAVDLLRTALDQETRPPR